MNESKTSIDMRRTGCNLQRLARKNGYSVKDIQKYLHLSCPQPVYRWYKGSVLPSVDNLLRLSELFHVHMEDILVKECSAVFLKEFVVSENNIQAFYKRMEAYFTLLAA